MVSNSRETLGVMEQRLKCSETNGTAFSSTDKCFHSDISAAEPLRVPPRVNGLAEILQKSAVQQHSIIILEK